MKYAWIDLMDDKRLWWFSIELAYELLEVPGRGLTTGVPAGAAAPTVAEHEQWLLTAAITVEHIAS